MTSISNILTNTFISMSCSGLSNKQRLRKKEYHNLLYPFPNKPWVLCVCSTNLFENTVGKGEIARNEQFLLFPTVFSTLLENFLSFSSIFKFSLEKSKICRLGKKTTKFQTCPNSKDLQTTRAFLKCEICLLLDRKHCGER